MSKLAEKPTAALVLSLIGGIFVLAGGAFQAFLGALISGFGGTTGATGASAFGSTVGILGILGMVFGIIMILGGVLMYVKPESHTMWGVIVLILSVISFATSSLGGFFIGFLLGLIGGILGIVFKPSTMGTPYMGGMGGTGGGMPAQVPSTMVRCPSCGAMSPQGTTKCPACGANI